MPKRKDNTRACNLSSITGCTVRLPLKGSQVCPKCKAEMNAANRIISQLNCEARLKTTKALVK